MAFGVLLMSLSFGLLIAAAQREDRPTNVKLTAKLPPAIQINDAGQLCYMDNNKLKPYQTGRLRYDAADDALKMSGVLPDIERDHMVYA